ncbi:MAG: hypothetical protein ABIQ38_07515 [Ilumatobacteraceae bacterium]
MNKKLIVAVMTSLIIANGSSVAMASGGSDDSSTTSTTSTTDPRTQNNSNLTGAQRAAQQAALRARQAAQLAQRAAQQEAPRARQAAQLAQRDAEAKYRLELDRYMQKRRLIDAALKVATVNAYRDFKVARQSATDRRSIKVATRAYLEAVRTATQAKNAALRALGAPPVRPSRP